MSKHWAAVKEEIEAEIDRIWREEPLEVKASRRGLFPSGAGSHGMAAGNLVFQIADTFTAGFGSAAKGLDWALGDGGMGLEQTEALFTALYGELAAHLGGKAVNGAAWLNLPKAWAFYQAIVEAFGSIRTKAELRSLLWSWKNYLKRLNLWFSLVFTWEVIGTLRTSKQVADYENLLALTRRAEPYMQAAVVSQV